MTKWPTPYTACINPLTGQIEITNKRGKKFKSKKLTKEESAAKTAATAEYIQKACNNYEAVLSTLYACLPFIEDCENNEVYKKEKVSKLLRKINKVLRKADRK